MLLGQSPTAEFSPVEVIPETTPSHKMDKISSTRNEKSDHGKYSLENTQHKKTNNGLCDICQKQFLTMNS